MLTNALSHERMTPLNSIVNTAEIVRKKFQKLTSDFLQFDNNKSQSCDEVKLRLSPKIIPKEPSKELNLKA